ncbi:MAG: hypothetical protein IPK96_09455 [Flammeovirgaceae bacterium]|jgi:hypothetical protein|nr:hypothetical protein [Flammeovirgaceae bacterium]MDZ7646373.1 hypothetical protein [Cytophagales bacterium]
MDVMDFGLYATYGFFVLAIVAAVVLPLVNALKAPAGLLRSLASVGGLVVVFIIAYAISGSELSKRAAASGITESSSKMIGAGLSLFYIVFVVAVLGVVFSEINKALK